MNNICRTASAAILVMVYLSVPSFGQDYSRTSGFYGFVGVGSSTDRADAVMHYGVGFETLLEGGFGVGLDLGLLHAPNSSADGAVFSVGGLYVFNREEKTKPFVTAGYSAFIVDDHGHNGAFVGAGVNHVLGDKWSVKLEIRDTFDVNEISDSQFIEGRAGVLFSWD